MSGNNSPGLTGVYGAKGVASGNNFPGGRNGHSMELDPSMNFLFVYGGWGRANSTTEGLFNANSD